MTKIVLENKKKEFEDKVMADCTFIPKVGASIDSASFASSRNNRIEELAEPKSVNDKRFNLEHSKLEESLRRPDIQANRTPSSATPSSSAFFQATKRAKDASAIADEIIKVVAAAEERPANKPVHMLASEGVEDEILSQKTPDTPDSMDSNFTPQEDKMSKAELQDDFEKWKAEMEQKMANII